MQCPFCSATDTRVVETREAAGSLRRRRECLSCKQRFTTYERIEQQQLRIIKKDGSRQLFDEAKLLRGIMTACEKRPVTIEDMEEAVQKVEHALRERGEAEIHSSVVGEKTMEVLSEIDEVAYIRFASVYKQFDNVEEFRREITELGNK